MPLTEKPDIDVLVARGDIVGLLKVLRAEKDSELRLAAARALVKILIDSLEHAHSLADVLDRALAAELACALKHTRALDEDLARAIALDHAIELTHNIDYARGLARSCKIADSISIVGSLDHALSHLPLRGLNPTPDRAPDFHLYDSLDGALALGGALFLARALSHNLASITPLDSVFVSDRDRIERYRAALEAAHASGDRPAAARQLFFLGSEFARQGDVGSAIAHYEGVLSESTGVLKKEQTQEVQAKLEALKEYRRRSASYFTSIKHPRRLSKRLSSRFKIFIYPSEDRAEVEKVLREAFDDEEWTGSVHPSGVETGDLVVLKLWSAEIEFSGEVVKRIEHDINQVTIGAKPKDTCHPGAHTVTLSISRKDTGEEISSVDFTVQVVDFAFDHVSRPLLSNVVSGVSGVFGAAAFVVTLFGDIDKALGLTAGTAALAVAAFFQARVWQLFRRPATTVTPYPP